MSISVGHLLRSVPGRLLLVRAGACCVGDAAMLQSMQAESLFGCDDAILDGERDHPLPSAV